MATKKSFPKELNEFKDATCKKRDQKILKCDHCGHVGHIIDKCYHIYCFPSNYQVNRINQITNKNQWAFHASKIKELTCGLLFTQE